MTHRKYGLGPHAPDDSSTEARCDCVCNRRPLKAGDRGTLVRGLHAGDVADCRKEDYSAGVFPATELLSGELAALFAGTKNTVAH